MNPVIGIIGGMGPLATCDLMDKIIRFTDAQKDQDHIRICVDSNTNIPDRTTAILHDGKTPVPELVKSALRLEAMGAPVSYTHLDVYKRQAENVFWKSSKNVEATRSICFLF